MATSQELTSLCARRGFLWPAADLYGGMAGFYDYGHNGVLLRRKFEDLWIDYFVTSREDHHLIDTTTILPEASLKASGHLDHFTDLMVGCTKCGEHHRVSQLLEDGAGKPQDGLSIQEADQRLKGAGVSCPDCGGNLGPVSAFNMMFGLQLGPAAKERAYLRPETAQGVFLNFKREFLALRRRLPLGLAAIGRAYRNEISPRQGPYRLREFLQAELQIFFDPERFEEQVPLSEISGETVRISSMDREDPRDVAEIGVEELVAKGIAKFYVYYMKILQEFYFQVLNVPPNRFRFREVPAEERAHYNRLQFDVEVDQESLGGFREVAGLHHRGDHDLGSHQRHSKETLEQTLEGRKVLPHVLELSFGIDRNVWMLLDLFYEPGERNVLHLPPQVSPILCGVFPLMAKDGLDGATKTIHKGLRAQGITCLYDEGGSLGKRYARIDELGVPYAVTVDYEAQEGKGVTLRDRDSRTQVRILEKELAETLRRLARGEVGILDVGTKVAPKEEG